MNHVEYHQTHIENLIVSGLFGDIGSPRSIRNHAWQRTIPIEERYKSPPHKDQTFPLSTERALKIEDLREIVRRNNALPILIQGESGSGKTYCIKSFYNGEHGPKYWFTASSLEVLAQQYLKLGEEEEWFNKKSSKQSHIDHLNIVRAKISKASLLVFHMVNPEVHAAGLIPSAASGRTVLFIPAHETDWPIDQYPAQLQFNGMGVVEGQHFLRDHLSEERTDEDIYLLYQAMNDYKIGAMPLHLLMAAGVLEKGEHLTITEYIREYQEIMERQRRKAEGQTNKTQSARQKAVFEMTLSHLKREHGLAYHAICLCSLLPGLDMPETIIKQVLHALSQMDNGEGSSLSEDIYEKEVVAIWQEHYASMDETTSKPMLRQELLEVQEELLYSTLEWKKYFLLLVHSLFEKSDSALRTYNRLKINSFYILCSALIERSNAIAPVESKLNEGEKRLYEEMVFQAAWLCWSVGDYQRAKNLFESCEREVANLFMKSNANNGFAVCQMNFGNFQLAYDSLERALAQLSGVGAEENPKNVEYLRADLIFNKGSCLMYQGEYASAEECFKSIQEDYSKRDSSAQMNLQREKLALYFIQEGATPRVKVLMEEVDKQAKLFLEDGINQRDMAYEILNTKACILWLDAKHNRQKLKEAESLFIHLLAKSKEDAPAHLDGQCGNFVQSLAILGGIYLERNDCRAAQHYFDSVLRRPSSAPLLINYSGHFAPLGGRVIEELVKHYRQVLLEPWLVAQWGRAEIARLERESQAHLRLRHQEWVGRYYNFPPESHIANMSWALLTVHLEMLRDENAILAAHCVDNPPPCIEAIRKRKGEEGLPPAEESLLKRRERFIMHLFNRASDFAAQRNSSLVFAEGSGGGGGEALDATAVEASMG